MPTRRSAPLWFQVLVAAAIAVALRVCLPGYGVADGAPGPELPTTHAFLGFLILIGSLIWKGLEIAGRVTLEVLKWMVVNLSLVVTKLGNGLKALGVDLLHAAKRAWDFTRRLYDDVLKPAWAKFWRWFDKFRKWLDDTFGPVIEWLQKVRKTLLEFWKTYVRPWLDLIDVTRRVLRVLSSLHIGWARKLDAWLGQLEAKIQWPFQFVLAKLNEVINVVNRIVTLDGLIQRVALVRSLARDYKYAGNIWWNTMHRAADPEDARRLTDPEPTKTVHQNGDDAIALWRGDAHPKRAAFQENITDMRIMFRSLRR